MSESEQKELNQRVVVLPSVVLEPILAKLDLIDIIDLSLKFPHIHITAKLLKIQANLKWLVRAPGHYAINILPDIPNTEKIVFRLSPPERNNEDRIGFLATKFYRRQRVFFIACGESQAEKHEMLKNLSYFLIRLFKIREFNFDSNIHFGFIGSYMSRFNLFKLVCPELTVEEVDILMEKKNIEHLQLDTTVISLEPVKISLKYSFVDLPTSGWIAPESLLEMSCTNLRIGKEAPYNLRKPDNYFIISPEGLAACINAWANGGLEQTKTMSMNCQEGCKRKYRNELFKLESINVVVDNTYADVYQFRRQDGRMVTVNFQSGKGDRVMLTFQ
ncbi:hypothetical protein GCK72_023226 [Caenorhabditis remanei]|uniref:F-box domain-containing protein n=1 Tax=Caenorhabditis remanei TaxID=31234 RepID=A0A6A5FWI7_CAERE|nr:hypothetical protein GCK72_023226 [Caenorhabditis remanei]KAF1746769.1 hypothetical protein GCK72_023226 [Caenorhabditis remanei]